MSSELKQRVFNYITACRPSGTELFDHFCPGPHEIEVKDAISELLDEGSIELTPDRRLVVRREK